MMHDDAFYLAILDNPDDDTPRLIFADWLEERGDPHADYIRLPSHGHSNQLSTWSPGTWQ